MKYAIIIPYIILYIMLPAAAGMGADISPSICNPGSEIVLYPNGHLKSCPLADDFAVNGVNCNP